MAGFVLTAAGPVPGHAADLEVRDVGVRTRFDDTTVLGDDQLIRFDEHDMFVTVQLPWVARRWSGWHVESRLLASAGILQGAGKTAIIASAIPVLAFEGRDPRFMADLGAGLAFLSSSQFDTQDYGGPFQVALTVGLGVRVHPAFGIGYRYLHYSDAGAYGSDSLGADFHMVELIYSY